MKKIIILFLSVFVFNVITVYAQELTKKEKRVQLKEKKEAERERKKAEEAERVRNKKQKKEAKHEAQYAKFKDMVNNYQERKIDTKNIAAFDTLIKQANALMEKVIVLEKEFDAVEMISEPYVDEDGVADTIWYARNKQTKEKYSNEEGRTLLNTQKISVIKNKAQGLILIAKGGLVIKAIQDADHISSLEKILLISSALARRMEQIKLICGGLTYMKYHLDKNAERLGFQFDNEGDECVDEDAELDEFSKKIKIR